MYKGNYLYFDIWTKMEKLAAIEIKVSAETSVKVHLNLVIIGSFAIHQQEEAIQIHNRSGRRGTSVACHLW